MRRVAGPAHGIGYLVEAVLEQVAVGVERHGGDEPVLGCRHVAGSAVP
jgi:hypothetical protein